MQARRISLQQIIRTTAGTAAGAALAFPGTVLWFSSWEAPYPGALCWPAYLMMGAGALGGCLWSLQSLGSRTHKLQIYCSAILVFGPLVSIAIIAFLLWATGIPGW